MLTMSSVAGVARCGTSGIPAQGSECIHFGESNGSTIWISHHNESPPCGLLRGPEDRNTKSLRLFFPPVWVLDLEAQRRCPCCRSRRKNASAVVTPIVSVQHDLSRGATDDDDDLVFESDREPEDVDVERLRLAEVSNKEDEAVVIVNSHYPEANEGAALWCHRTPAWGDPGPPCWRDQRRRSPDAAGSERAGGRPAAPLSVCTEILCPQWFCATIQLNGCRSGIRGKR